MNNFSKWALAALFVAALAFLPQAAEAADTDYIVRDWNEETQSVTEQEREIPADARTVTADDSIWETGTYVVSENVTINRRITVTGEVKLILKDGCALNVGQGINVAPGNSLYIYGQANDAGKLDVISYDGNAAIGGNNRQSGGSIIIHGGQINASATGFSGNSGAAIGGGAWEGIGKITINGGIITARSSISGPNKISGDGIGAGAAGNASSGDVIIICGGTISSTSAAGGLNTSVGDGIGNGDASSENGGFALKGGKAVVFAEPNIVNNSRDNWNGIVFEGATGTMYGTEVTPPDDFTVPENATLKIGKGQTLNIPESVTMTVNGTLDYTEGIINCYGKIEKSESGTITPPDSWNNVPSTTTLTDLPESVKVGDTVTLTATIAKQDGGTFDTTEKKGRVTFYSSETLLGSAEVKTEDGTLKAIYTHKFDQAGICQLTAKYSGGDGRLLPLESSLNITVNKQTQDAPDSGEGYIINCADETLTAESGYELSIDGKTPSETTSFTNIVGNTYYVRHAETEEVLPSDWVEITIPARPAAPANVSGGTEQISGVDSSMEYRAVGSTGWTRCTGTSISNLSDGDYEVRIAATDSAFASEAVQVHVSPYTGKYSYEIATDIGDNGTLSVDRYATEGERVTITVSPDDAYKLDDLSVTAQGKDVELTDNGDGTFTFTMPSGDVRITVTFAEDPDWTPEEPATDVSEIFIDVAPNAWYKDAVQYAYDNGLMTGVSANEFAPEATTTRAMIVSILARLENVTSAESAGFADVSANDWYATAVNWAASAGVVSGTGDGNSSPNAAITREQLAAMLMNYSAWKGEDVSARADLSVYSDQPSTWAEETMNWAVAEGLISGVTNTQLQPQGNATRAQVAAILQRFLCK